MAFGVSTISFVSRPDVSTDSPAINSHGSHLAGLSLDSYTQVSFSFGRQLALVTPPSQGDHLVSPVVAKATWIRGL